MWLWVNGEGRQARGSRWDVLGEVVSYDCCWSLPPGRWLTSGKSTLKVPTTPMLASELMKKRKKTPENDMWSAPIISNCSKPDVLYSHRHPNIKYHKIQSQRPQTNLITTNFTQKVPSHTRISSPAPKIIQTSLVHNRPYHANHHLLHNGRLKPRVPILYWNPQDLMCIKTWRHQSN